MLPWYRVVAGFGPCGSPIVQDGFRKGSGYHVLVSAEHRYVASSREGITKLECPGQ